MWPDYLARRDGSTHWLQNPRRLTREGVKKAAADRLVSFVPPRLSLSLYYLTAMPTTKKKGTAASTAKKGGMKRGRTMAETAAEGEKILAKNPPASPKKEESPAPKRSKTMAETAAEAEKILAKNPPKKRGTPCYLDVFTFNPVLIRFCVFASCDSGAEYQRSLEIDLHLFVLRHSFSNIPPVSFVFM